MSYTDFMIPAQESFVRDQLFIEREELLADNQPLYLFATYGDHSYYNAKLHSLQMKYHFEYCIVINWDKLIDQINDGKSITTEDPKLAKMLDDCHFTSDTTLRVAMNKVVEISTAYSRMYNAMVVIQSNEYTLYSDKETQKYPVLMVNISRLKAYMKRYISPWDPKRKLIDTNFNRAFGTKIPKKLIVKYTPKLHLYHISQNLELTELEPRLTHRPLNAQENMRIPRISCAPTVDGCFRGAQFNYNCTVKVYELLLNKDSIIVRPDRYLVPDRDLSDEYWVLTKTKVKPVVLIELVAGERHPDGTEMKYRVIEEYK